MKSSFCPTFCLQVAISRALVFIFGIQIHIWIGSAHHESAMADKKQFSNIKSIVKVETGIVTLISYGHYLKIVGNNKL